MPVITYLTTCIFDSGALKQLANVSKNLGITRPFIVTDPGIKAVGILAKVEDALGVAPAGVFADTVPNPLESQAKQAAAAALDAAIEREKAEAFARQIEADFAKPKSGPGVNGVWEKRKDIIDYLARKHDDLHQNLLDAFSSRIREIEGETDDFGLPPVDDFPGDRVRA